MGADPTGAGNAGQRTGTSNGVCFHLIVDMNIKLILKVKGKFGQLCKSRALHLIKRLKK